MAKFWILSVLALAALVQVSLASYFLEFYNNDLRDKLNLYVELEKEADSANYLVELKKLISLTEGALKSTSEEEKKTFLEFNYTKFSEEFNTWLDTKLQEAQVNDKIQRDINRYSSYLSVKTEFEADIKKTVSTLENLLKERNWEVKIEKFFGLKETFNPEYKKFLEEHDLASTNFQLQELSEFYESLLLDKDLKFTKEIEALRVKAVAALSNYITIDEKEQVLKEVNYTDNTELNEYLLKKRNTYIVDPIPESQGCKGACFNEVSLYFEYSPLNLFNPQPVAQHPAYVNGNQVRIRTN